MIGWLVDRLHVSEPDRAVVEYVLERVKYQPGPRSESAVLSDAAHFAIERHRANQRLYVDVMHGGV